MDSFMTSITFNPRLLILPCLPFSVERLIKGTNDQEWHLSAPQSLDKKKGSTGSSIKGVEKKPCIMDLSTSTSRKPLVNGNHTHFWSQRRVVTTKNNTWRRNHTQLNMMRLPVTKRWDVPLPSPANLMSFAYFPTVSFRYYCQCEVQWWCIARPYTLAGAIINRGWGSGQYQRYHTRQRPSGVGIIFNLFPRLKYFQVCISQNS